MVYIPRLTLEEKAISRIALYTFGILHGQQDHKQAQEFIDRISSVFEVAKNAKGFIDLAREDWGHYSIPRFFDKNKHAAPLSNLSLWKDLESVYAFTYRGRHGETFKKRGEWFLEPEWPTYVAWWVEDDHIPTWEEACKRHEYLHDNGPSPFAFNFKQPFNDMGQPTTLDREII